MPARTPPEKLVKACKEALVSLRSMYKAIENGATAEELYSNLSYWPLAILRDALEASGMSSAEIADL